LAEKVPLVIEILAKQHKGSFLGHPAERVSFMAYEKRPQLF